MLRTVWAIRRGGPFLGRIPVNKAYRIGERFYRQGRAKGAVGGDGIDSKGADRGLDRGPNSGPNSGPSNPPKPADNQQNGNQNDFQKNENTPQDQSQSGNTDPNREIHPTEDNGDTLSAQALSVIPNEHGVPVYHFDTQKVYANLKYAGFTHDQAQTIMTTIRDMLSDVLHATNDRCVPNAAAANDAYLFKAASSEVRHEVHTSRDIQLGHDRARLSRLQREVEIMQHEADEMATLLKADMDMDINDRKNAARIEENAISLKLQEVNNKINVGLASDVKSIIEELRWQITRRGIVGIVFAAASLLYLTQIYKAEMSAKQPQKQEEPRAKEVQVPVLSHLNYLDEYEEPQVESLSN